MGTAGYSADEKAQSARHAAETLERKARSANEIADTYAKGADGERTVAVALAPLTARGWYVLHDRVMVTGGNIDHIVIGPAGVVVIDAKAWKDASVVDGHLKSGSWKKDKVVDALALQVAAVRAAAGPATRTVGILAMVNQPDMEAATAGDAIVVGVDHLAETIEGLGDRFEVRDIEEKLRAITLGVPAAGAAPPEAFGMVDVDPGEFTGWSERSQELFYLQEWKKGGRHRLYLKDHHGIDHGFRDLIAKTSHPEGDNPFAIAILDAASTGALRLSRDSLPRVPQDVRGGRFFRSTANRFKSLLVGQLARHGSTVRMYGTYASPTTPIIKLGFVDMSTRFMKPDSDGPLHDRLEPAAHYLAILRDNYPERPADAAKGQSGR